MGYISFNEVCKMLGIKHKSVEELAVMSPEERQEYYKEHTWCRGERDDEPIKLDFDAPCYDGENLLLYFDDRWMEGKK